MRDYRYMPEMNRNTRPDLRIDFYTHTIYVDVSFVSTSCVSNLQHAQAELGAAKHRETEKVTHYEKEHYAASAAASLHRPVTVVPFVIETSGALAPQALELIDKLAVEADRMAVPDFAPALRRDLAFTVQQWNARINMAGLHMLHVTAPDAPPRPEEGPYFGDPGPDPNDADWGPAEG